MKHGYVTLGMAAHLIISDFPASVPPKTTSCMKPGTVSMAVSNSREFEKASRARVGESDEKPV